jgi:protein-L-isoaspartate(D-aspartate) O-methyltransferase
MRGAFLVAVLAALTPAADSYERARAGMVREVSATYRSTSNETGRAALDPRVARVLSTVPRHLFVPLLLRGAAYENRPLPIGHGQTISQPYIVALMTDLLRLERDDVVLEIGTGSGYQAAVLSPLVKQLHTVEIIEPLADDAAQRLRRLGYGNVTVHHADGYEGWPAAAPFDAIIVTAAATHIPPPLIRQLKPGGRMIIPVGGAFSTQSLMLVQKNAAGKVTTRNVLPVAFVPLTRKE